MSVTRTVVPGDWYGVLGETVIVLLPPAAKSRVAGLWETVDDGAGFDEVLDALISDGLRGLPGFVLVSGGDRDVKVVIRGAGSAELDTADGPVVVSGSPGTTWVEQNVGGVTGLRVRVADGTGAAYAVETGLMRVASVEHPASSAVGTGVPGVPEVEAVVVPGVPEVEAVAVPVALPVAPPSPPAEPERPKRILPPDPQLESEEPSPPPVPEPAAPSTSGARLRFSSGEVVDLDRVVVVGRAPAAGGTGGEGQVRLVTVPSPQQEISSTHLEVRPGAGHGSAVVTDLGSTNGTVVVQPGLPAEDLRPGVAVQLAPGTTIDLGEGVTIQIEVE